MLRVRAHVFFIFIKQIDLHGKEDFINIEYSTYILSIKYYNTFTKLDSVKVRVNFIKLFIQELLNRNFFNLPPPRKVLPSAKKNLCGYSFKNQILQD